MLYNNISLYSQLLGNWGRILTQYGAPHALKGSWTHPVTGNLWAMRADGLFEISKSGIQVKRPDGQCMPSGLALCSPCMYADAGGLCQPCSTYNQGWAAHIQCNGCYSNQSRRLLQKHKGISIQFEAQLSGPGSIQKSAACNMPGDWTHVDDRWAVSFSSQNPAECVRQLTAELAHTFVSIRPYSTMELPLTDFATPAPPSQQEDKGTSQLLIVVISTLSSVLLLVVLFTVLYCYLWPSNPLRHKTPNRWNYMRA